MYSRMKKLLAAFLAAILSVSAIFWFAYKDKYMITAHIKNWANDPDSVSLRDLRQSKRDKEVWCGEINARNRMGGMAGFQKFVFVQPGFGELRIANDIDRLLSEMTLEGAAVFDSKYRLFCT